MTSQSSSPKMISSLMKMTPAGPVEITDAHGHFFTRTFFEALIAQSPELRELASPLDRVAELTGWRMPPATPAELAAEWERELTERGVARALLMASLPGHEDSIGAAVAAFPERIIGGFFLDPNAPGAVDRARRAFDDLGLRVACLFPAMHHYSVAECPGVEDVAALASARPGTAMLVHCGVLSVGVRRRLGLPSPFDMRRSNPLDLYRIAARYPSVPFIIPHFGAGMFREALMLADLCPNVFFDTSSSNGWIRYEPTPLDLKMVFQRALAVVGPERLLFGTDSSFFPRGWHEAIFDRQVAILDELNCDQAAVQAIFGGNLCRILRIAALSGSVSSS